MLEPVNKVKGFFKRESKDTGSTKDTSITADMANLANDAADKNQSVKDTLAVLQDKIDLFQNEVDVATQEMMNRIEIDTSLMKVGMVNLANNTSSECLNLRILLQELYTCLELVDLLCQRYGRQLVRTQNHSRVLRNYPGNSLTRYT